MPTPLSGVFPADLFTAICRDFPNKSAIRGEGVTLSYADLGARTARRAAWLHACGVRQGARVGLRIGAACDFIEWVVACVRLGAVYVPIDTSLPVPAAAQAIGAAAVAHLVVEASERDAAFGEVAVLDAPPAAFDGAGLDWAPGPQQADEPVCIMFTSGSTGVPKGVVCPLGGIVPLVTGESHLPILCDDVVLQISAREFDAFTWEIWGALLKGACLHLLPAKWSVAELGRQIADGGVTAAFFTARLFDLLVEAAPATLAGMRLIGFGGEPASPRHCALARRLLPDTLLVNGYGPTENTTFSCSYVLGEGLDDETMVPIGVPRMGDTAALIDPATLAPVTGEGVGELYLGGPGLAIGYTDAAVTAQRFVWHEGLGARFFRTGDLVQRLADGSFHYLGRLDRQVKILGRRVNLFEVEAALASHPRIAGAHVVFEPVFGRSEQLIAFCRSHDGVPVPRAELIDFLAGKLDSYAIPHWFEPVETPPLKQNGKVDVARLVADLKARVSRDGHGDLLTRLWARLLHPAPVGEETDFFREGGDSLAALTLMLETEKLFDLALPADYLLRHPVLADFRRHLFSTPASAPSLVTPSTPMEGEAALVLVPWLNGSPNTFSHLVAELRFAGRIVTLDMTRLEADRSIRHIRDISRLCADALLAQGVTRVSLAGPSLGGIIALDLGAELAQRGVSVETIILLDSYAPALISLDILLTQIAAGRAALVDWRGVLRRLTGGRGRTSRGDEAGSGVDSALLNRMLDGFGHSRNFRPRIPAARAIVLFKAALQEARFLVRRAPDLGWRRRVPQLQTRVAVGDHMSMLDRTNGPSLAAQLSAILAGELNENVRESGTAERAG